MDRQKDLSELKSYIEAVDKDVTLILQSLQWDRKRLLETPAMVTCRHDQNHRIPADTCDAHEQQCMFRSEGYSNEDQLLPDPPDPAASTLVRLDNNDINKIIYEAAQLDPLFKKGAPHTGPLPHSVSRLQQAYTADERRAIHDAVVAAAPSTHDLAELALAIPHDSGHPPLVKSRAEVLAELRNARRRRTKYRTANTKNYSNTLRDVISAQMELFGIKTEATIDKITIKIEKDDDRSTSNTNIGVGLKSSQTNREHNVEQFKQTHRECHYTSKDTERSRQSGLKHRKENEDGEYTDRSHKRSRDASYSNYQDDYRRVKDTRDTRHKDYRDRGTKDNTRGYSRDRSSKSDHYKYENRPDKISNDRHTESSSRSKRYYTERQDYSNDRYTESSSRTKKYDKERYDNHTERHKREHRNYDTTKVKEEPNDDGYRDRSTSYEHSTKRSKHH